MSAPDSWHDDEERPVLEPRWYDALALLCFFALAYLLWSVTP